MRDAKFYGKLLKYCYTVICPECKKKQSYKPQRKGKLYADLNPKAVKMCVVCGKPFNVKNNLIGERDRRNI